MRQDARFNINSNNIFNKMDNNLLNNSYSNNEILQKDYLKHFLKNPKLPCIGKVVGRQTVDILLGAEYSYLFPQS